MRPSVLRLALVTLALTALLLAVISPALRPEAVYLPGAYPGKPPTSVPVLRALALLLPLGLCLAGLRAFFAGTLRGRWLCVVALVSSYLAIQFFGLLQEDGAFAMHRRIYRASYARDALLFESFEELLATYDQRHDDLTGHGRTHPPGSAALHWLSMRSARWLAATFGPGEDPAYEAFVVEGYLGAFLWPWIQVLWLVPVWALARRLYGERVAAIAVVFGALAPSAVVISPSSDAMLPLFAATGIYALERGFDSGRFRWSLLLGVISAMASLITWAFGMLAPLYLAYFVFRRTELARSRWWHVPVGLAGGGLVLAALHLLYGFRPFEQLTNDLGTHYEHGVNAVRPYWVFLVVSPSVFFLWSGVPLASGFFLGLVRSRPLRALRERAGDPLVLASFVGLVFLSISGATRGETERLWLPLLPFVVASGAQGLAAGSEGRPVTGRDELGWAAMLGGTLLSAILLGNWWFHHR